MSDRTREASSIGCVVGVVVVGLLMLLFGVVNVVTGLNRRSELLTAPRVQAVIIGAPEMLGIGNNRTYRYTVRYRIDDQAVVKSLDFSRPLDPFQRSVEIVVYRDGSIEMTPVEPSDYTKDVALTGVVGVVGICLVLWPLAWSKAKKKVTGNGGTQ